MNWGGVDLPLPPAIGKNGIDFGSDPTLTFDTRGNLFYGYIVVFFGNGSGVNGSQMAVARSTNGGQTYSSVNFFGFEGGSNQFNDKPMITVDNGPVHHNRVYLAWDNATGNSSSDKNGNNVVLAHSDDAGATFSAPVSVSGDFVGRTGGIGADPYVTGDGTLHVAWQDYAHSTITDAASVDGGLTFGSRHAVAPVAGFDFAVAAMQSRRALVYPACGSYRATLYCSYTNGSAAATSTYVARSTDAGVTWSSSPVPGGGDKFNQWLAVDSSDGSVNVAYYDTGTHGATATRFTLARSTNGGRTYAASPIANATTDESCCAPSVDGFNQYGDYEGLAAAGGVLHPVWTDRRQDVISRGLREEVFSATLKP